ncbi:hypothetical protein VCRA2133E348_340003 [Vibrio crassostreae]|nr:hypothetical protein VCRA2133E348_340003 [Vibrio crassostreae]
MCDNTTIIKQIRGEVYEKKAEKMIENMSEHRTSAKAFLSCLYEN